MAAFGLLSLGRRFASLVPARTFAKLRSNKNQVQRPGSSFRRTHCSRYADSFGGQHAFARSTEAKTWDDGGYGNIDANDPRLSSGCTRQTKHYELSGRH
jgi:hypothetical protein